MGLEVTPDTLDVIQLRCVLGQPLDGQPMRTRGECGPGEFADVDGTVVQHQHHRFGRLAWSGAIQPIQLFEMADEVAASLGRTAVHDELVRDVIERAQHRHFLRLTRCRHPQIGTRLGPDASEIGVGQRLTLIAIEQDNVAARGLLFAQLQPQADALDLGRLLASLQRVPRPPPTELFYAAPWIIASG